MSSKIAGNGPTQPYSPTRRESAPSAQDVPSNAASPRLFPLVPVRAPQTDSIVLNSHTRRWLEMIGDRVAELPSAGMRFHRQSPTSGVLSVQRQFVVTFDAQSGEPRTAHEGSRLPDAASLTSGEAAALINYYDLSGRNFIKVDPQLVGATMMVSERAAAVLTHLQLQTPVVRPRDVDVHRVGEGREIIVVDEALHEHNRRFVDALLGNARSRSTRMTMMFDRDVSNAFEAVNQWLVERSVGIAPNNLSELLGKRVSGETQFDLYLDATGRFIGGAAGRDAAHSPRGTMYTAGMHETAAAVAKHISFLTHEAPDGTRTLVPVSYGWEHDDGNQEVLAREAFRRWYHSPDFERMRSTLAGQEELTKLMFDGMAPAERFARLAAVIKEHPASPWELSAHSNNVMERIEQHRDRVPDLGDELLIMHLEILMRDALGDAAVDAAMHVSPQVASILDMYPDAFDYEDMSFMEVPEIPRAPATEATTSTAQAAVTATEAFARTAPRPLAEADLYAGLEDYDDALLMQMRMASPAQEVTPVQTDWPNAAAGVINGVTQPLQAMPMQAGPSVMLDPSYMSACMNTGAMIMVVIRSPLQR